MASERDILDIISLLRGRRGEIEESIQQQLASVDADIAAAERTLELRRELLGAPLHEANGLVASDLRGMSQMQALRAIAMHNDGILVIRDARRLFIEANLTTTRYISQAIRAIANRSGRFEYHSPGRLRLLTQPEPTNNGQHQEE